MVVRRSTLFTPRVVLAVAVAAFLVLRVAKTQIRSGPTVTLAVQANGSSQAVLHYQWRSTDGHITDLDSPTTSWNLPSGPGLHFAYVLVSNGLGGYTERRIAVNTDGIGTNAGQLETHQPYQAPPAPAQAKDYFREFLSWGYSVAGTSSTTHRVYVPNVLTFFQDASSLKRFPATGTISSGANGQIVALLPVPGTYNMKCSVDGGLTFSDCGGHDLAAARTRYVSVDDVSNVEPITGRLTLQDGSPCGTINEFFGVRSSPTATLLDGANRILAGPRPINELGDFALPYDPRATTVLLRCENATPVKLTPWQTRGGAYLDLGQTTLAGVNPPSVTGMTATLNGKVLAPPDAIFLPPPTGFPSDILPRADGYLAEKGLDSRLGACQYYKAIGAVRDCDSDGTLIGAIAFTDWKRAMKIDQFSTGGTPTFKAAYINKVDLNLARVHESISYGPNQTAAVVCNHLGPPGATPLELMNPAQSDIDTAVDNAVANRNLVACVAMDYTVSPGVNNNQPFIRFLIFGPSGELLPSVNLDGRREKFVPGTCVVCHGGDHYAGQFPEHGSGFANVGGHFLPYDTGNFEFSRKAGLTEADQETNIFHLNRNVLNAGPTPAEIDLINGWYQNSQPNARVLDKNYVPPSWLAASNPTATVFYRDVVARSCRTCHAAMIEDYNFDHYSNVAAQAGADFFSIFAITRSVCGGTSQIVRSHTMPNSLITFNRFWLSGVPTGPQVQLGSNSTGVQAIIPIPGSQPNQPALFTKFYASDPNSQGCPTPAGLLP